MAGCLGALAVIASAVILPAVGEAEETGGIAGKVTGADTGLSVAGVEVCAEQVGVAGTLCATTASTGEYEIAGLALGQYTVEFTPPASAEYFTQFYSGATSVDLATPVEVTAGAITPGIDATLVKEPPPGPGGISGLVTAAGSGAPVAGVEVCAEQVAVAGTPCATTASTGEYEIAGLTAGQYTVEFTPSAAYFTQFYSGATSAAGATPVGVAAGTVTSGIDAILAKVPTGPGKIKGRVTAAEGGSAVGGVKVCAEQVGVTGSRCETTVSNGEYALRELPAGQWRITFDAQETKRNLLSLAYPNKEIWETPTPIALSPAEEKTVNVALKTGGQITGTVSLAATGAPAAGVRVCLTEAEFFASLACLTTPSSGAYRFTAIYPGSFKVVFSAAAGEFPDSTPIADPYSTQWWSGQPSYATAVPIAIAPPATIAGIGASLTLPSTLSTAAAPVATTGAPATVAVSAAKAKAKKRRCRTGYARRKVKGKLRCVKAKTAAQKHKKAKHKKRHKKSA